MIRLSFYQHINFQPFLILTSDQTHFIQKQGTIVDENVNLRELKQFNLTQDMGELEAGAVLERMYTLKMKGELTLS